MNSIGLPSLVVAVTFTSCSGLRSVVDLDVERSFAGEAQAAAVLALLVLQRQHAHADQIAAVNSLEAFGDDGFHAQQIDALGGPVAAGAHAVVFAGQHDQWNFLRLVFHAGVVDAA